MTAFGRALRQVWMRRVTDPTLVEMLLRHPAFHDRAVLERALSRRFFAPFMHQEVVVGERFEARSRWSRAALAHVGVGRVRDAGEAACDAELGPRLAPSLLEDVRRVVVRATVDLALGDLALIPVVFDAVQDIDRGIKMIGRASRPKREGLKRALEKFLGDASQWTGETYLTAAREEATSLPLGERVDHVAAVFLATGSIQVTDMVTHALIALAQHPEHASATDEAVFAETLRLFPVNSSITRQASQDVELEGSRYARGEPVTFVPVEAVGARAWDPSRHAPHSTWSFGTGPRACPARRVATTLAMTVLARYRALGVRIEPNYRHQRSLAMPVHARIGPGDAPPATSRAERLAEMARFVRVCAESYPAAFLGGARELWTTARMGD